MTPLDRTADLSFFGTATRIRRAACPGCPYVLPPPFIVTPIETLKMCRFGLIRSPDPNRPAVRHHGRRRLNERPAQSHSTS
jgi:hypothetical protein